MEGVFFAGLQMLRREDITEPYVMHCGSSYNIMLYEHL